ncbi:MAG TPA: YqgE/AlgH family protein [Steroidobacteraceae bacterium]|nr:YqgE/AlgH family protein [Steroidobacteraceae bacterium]
MATSQYLTNQFLIAMPALADANFSQTVTYICEHNEAGALGLVINRPLKMKMSEVFEQLKMPTPPLVLANQSVLHGGPVQTDRGFVVHSAGKRWDATLPVSERIHVTTSRDILDALSRGEGPEIAFIALGYAGWDAGQLETEVANNAWLTVPCDERILFQTPFEQRWHEAARLLGVDLAMISSEAGHA